MKSLTAKVDDAPVVLVSNVYFLFEEVEMSRCESFTAVRRISTYPLLLVG